MVWGSDLGFKYEIRRLGFRIEGSGLTEGSGISVLGLGLWVPKDRAEVGGVRG